MSCESVRDELLPLYPDDLEPSEATLVREHVATCLGCAAELAAYAASAAARATYVRERELPAGFLDGLADRALAEAKRRDEEEARRPIAIAFATTRSRLFRAGLVAAAAAVALVVGSRWWSPDPVSSQAPAPVAKVVPAPSAPVTPAPRTPAVVVNDGPKAAPVRRPLRRFFGQLDQVEVFPAGGGRTRRLAYDEDVTIPVEPGTEFKLQEGEPATPGTKPRAVSF